MKKSLRFQSVLIISLHVFLLLLLLWAAAVPLEQLQQYVTDNIGEIGNRVACQGNLAQLETLIWSAIVFTAVIGFIIPWTIFRWVQNPIRSIRNTIRQFSRGDLEPRIRGRNGKEFEVLANELNGMMEHQKQEHGQLRDLNRTLSAISACRHVMIHEIDEKRLNQQICRILVDIGAYRMAQVGYTEEDTHGTMTAKAPAGYQSGGLNADSASRAETAFNPATRAIRNRHSAIISDVFGDSLFAPLQAEAARHGYASIIALPLSVNQQILGALTLYAEKPDMFGTEAVRLLTELADDLAYRINAIRHKDDKKVHTLRYPEESKS
ncbi:MAG: GAF domain-containing protein [Pseudomonadota bacterium]